MVKSTKGLPGGFNLDLGTDDSPTILGDFLDDAPTPPRIERAEMPRATPVTDVGHSRHSETAVRNSDGGREVSPSPVPATPAFHNPQPVGDTPRPRADEYIRVKRPRRKEVHLTPDTQAMLEGLV